MKAIKLLAAMVMVSGLSFGQFRNVEMQAAGLTCSMCSNAIYKALKTVPFVAAINTDLKNNLFKITLKEDSEPDFDLLKKKVEDAGFSVAKMTVDINFEKVRVQRDEHTMIGSRTFHFLKVKDQILDGWQKVQIVDKDFLLSSQYKKFKTATSMPCYETGVAGNCCQKGPIKAGERIYHITI